MTTIVDISLENYSDAECAESLGYLRKETDIMQYGAFIVTAERKPNSIGNTEIKKIVCDKICAVINTSQLSNYFFNYTEQGVEDSKLNRYKLRKSAINDDCIKNVYFDFFKSDNHIKALEIGQINADLPTTLMKSWSVGAGYDWGRSPLVFSSTQALNVIPKKIINFQKKMSERISRPLIPSELSKQFEDLIFYSCFGAFDDTKFSMAVLYPKELSEALQFEVI